MDQLTERMKRLSEADGVSGYEREVRQLMQEYLEPISDEVLRDRMGSIVGKKVGQADGPKVLVVGHMDEIGFMVTHVDEEGFISVIPLGGWWTHVMLGQRVKIKGRNGDVIGVFGAKPPHVLTAEERSKTVPMKEVFVDIGAKSREEVDEMFGIRLGDPVTPLSDLIEMRNGEYWAGKAIDNRAGCLAAVELLEALKGADHPNVVYSGATVQEEVGVRGAVTLANLVQPDVAIVFDVGQAYDTPGLDKFPNKANIGDGPNLMLLDSTMIPNLGLRDLVLEVAKEAGIPVQVDAQMGGGTDGWKIHVSGIGVPTIVMGFPVRYMHSHTTIIARHDLEKCVELAAAVVKRLDQKTLESLID